MSSSTIHHTNQLGLIKGVDRAGIEGWTAYRSLELAKAARSVRRVSEVVGWDEWFNADNLDWLRRRRVATSLIELFEWAMELEDVEALAPRTRKESLDRIYQLAFSVLGKTYRIHDRAAAIRAMKGS